MSYSREEEHNYILADIITNNCASNDSFGSGILTQPPENDKTIFTYTNNNHNNMEQQAKQAASNKRKSKLKKGNRQSSSSKSVLETMPAETALAKSGASTTTSSDTAETKDVSPYPIDLTNSPSPQNVQATHPTITPASERIVEQRKSATLPDPSVAAFPESNEVKVAPSKKKKAKKSKQSTEDTKDAVSSESQSATSQSAAKSTDNTKQKPVKQSPIKKKQKKKKRSFHDQVLYTMLTSCKPYNIKSLAKATDTTAETLRHAMLSFVDKKLVLTKEFPSKKDSAREPKKLYWANPLTMSQIESSNEENKGKGGGVAKELAKLLSNTDEIQEANTTLQQLQQRHRIIQDELRPLLAIPTMKHLDDDNITEEKKLTQVQNEIQAVKDRIANAMSNKESATAPNNRMSQGYARFQQPKQSKPQDKTTLKRKINHMLSEYKTRKRICMDFVEEIADAMEKKPKDVMGDKVFSLDTDEMEWGVYEDMSTGKIYGKPKQAKKGKNNNEEEQSIVKIPAKYKDV